MLLAIFALLLFPGLALAALEKGTTKIYAVTSEGKGLVANLTIETEPGSGKIWSSVTPLVGTSTQNAERTAISLAKKYSEDVGKYDYKFTIESPASVVDGPSAGAAMSLLAISMLTDRSLPEDVSLTGTVNSEGKIGPVGGIFEKAKEASSTGIKLFLIPKGEALQTRYEGSEISSVNLLDYAPKNWGMKVVEVRDIDEAVKYAFADIHNIDVNTDAGDSVPEFIPERLPLSPDMSGFKVLVSNYADKAKETVSDARSALSASLLEDPDLRHLLQGTLNSAESTAEKAEILNGQNYLYSAANYSYLAMADAITVREIALNPSILNEGSTGFDLRLAELHSEIEYYKRDLSGNVPKKNVEWFVSAQQRLTYSENNVRRLMTEQVVVLGGSDEDKMAQAFIRVQDYAFAMAWLEVSKDFYNLSQDDFEFAKPSDKFKAPAGAKIAEAKKLIDELETGDGKDDSKRRLDSAVSEIDLNWFEASYFDAAAAKAIAESELYLDANWSVEDLNVALSQKIKSIDSKVLGESAGLAWVRLYLDHAKYFLEASDYYLRAGSDFGAEESLKRGISLAYLAENLYQPSKEVRETYSALPKVSGNGGNGQSKGSANLPQQDWKSMAIYAAFSLAVAMLVFGTGLILVSRQVKAGQSVESKVAAVKKSLYGLESQLVAGKIEHDAYEKKKREYAAKLSQLEAERKEKAKHLIACDNCMMDLGIMNEKMKNLKKHLNDGLISKQEFDQESKLMIDSISSLEARLGSEIAALKRERSAAAAGQSRQVPQKTPDEKNYLPAKTN